MQSNRTTKRKKMLSLLILLGLMTATIVGINDTQVQLKKTDEQLIELHSKTIIVEQQIKVRETFQDTYYTPNLNMPPMVQIIPMQPTQQYSFCTDEEVEQLMWVVSAEVGADYLSDESRILVTNVILNRLKDPRFPKTITEILNQKGQFSTISNYTTHEIPVSDNTRQCVKRALDGEDLSNGSLYYYEPSYVKSKKITRWFEQMDFVLECDGQRYFK